MKILAIETTGPKASVAVLTEDGVKEIRCQEQMNHLRYLMPMISEGLEAAGISLEEVDVIAVSEGPGSFTGIRIGVSSAKALAQALEKPVVTVPTLKAFVYHDQRERVLSCVAFDARRSQVYGGMNLWDGEKVKTLVEDGAYMADQFMDLVGACLREQKAALQEQGFRRILLYGDGSGLLEKALEQGAAEELLKLGFAFETAEESLRYQSAVSVACYAADMLKKDAGAGKGFYQVKPVYLRKAEAERKLEETLSGKKDEGKR